MRCLIIFALVCAVIGAGLVLFASSLPVYNDPGAPGRLSGELEALPREERFEEWYSRLQKHETPHKKLADVGRGLLALGFGIGGAVGLWKAYHRYEILRKVVPLLIIWNALWAIRIPLSEWYHMLRQRRSDYPPWGDSIGIPIYSESVAWVLGAIVTTAVLVVLRVRHPLPATIRISKPASLFTWLRAFFIGLWLVLLILCVVSGVLDGDEGMVIGPVVGCVVLLAFLSAKQERDCVTPDKEPHGGEQSTS